MNTNTQIEVEINGKKVKGIFVEYYETAPQYVLMSVILYRENGVFKVYNARNCRVLDEDERLIGGYYAELRKHAFENKKEMDRNFMRCL